MTAPPRHPMTPHPRQPRGPNIRLRVYAVALLLGLASVGLAVRAVDLQVVRNGFLQKQGDARFLRTQRIPVSRGSIFDRNGEPLAVSTPVESIWADPGVLLKHADRLPALAKALGIGGSDLTHALRKRASREFVYLQRQLPPAVAKAVMDLNVPGVHERREYKRFYPSGSVTAHVLGYTNIDDDGQEGLELAFQDALSGTPGEKRVIRDRLGHVVENVEMVREPQPGRDLTLSIDQRIQYLAFRDLQRSVQKHGAMSGSVVVMDVRTGEILAMVNQPTYNPNNLDSSHPGQRRNRAVTDVIEPGSVMKPFTVAAALESGKWTPNTPINTSPGTLRLDGHVIHDTEDHGELDVTSVLTHSSNVGASKIALTLNAQNMFDVFRRFGFGSTTGSGFPGESAGVLPPGNTWTDLRKATISYGYGVSVTALQLARAYAALGDDGRMHTPTFLKGGGDQGEAVIDPQIAHEIVRMLETVVSPDGTGLKAAVANYSVAGKTGTSHIASGGGYSNRYVSLFVGLAPASSPRLVVVAEIKDPTVGSYYASQVAAPLCSAVMTGALRLLDIPPDNVRRWYVGAPDTGAPISGRNAPDYAPGNDNYQEGAKP